MSNSFDIVIIGAGPAGMAAAQTAAKHGAKTLILDEQSAPGGQIYRAIETMGQQQRPALGKAYLKGIKLTRDFRNSDVQYVPGASVWELSKERKIAYSCKGSTKLVTGKQIIIASGAQERPIPVRGWTLPGVMMMGAAQILLKESEIAIKDAIFAGTGPLFYLVIHQYLQAGIPVKAVIDLTPKENYRHAIVQLPKALLRIASIVEGFRWKRAIIKSGVPFICDVKDIKITGSNKATGIDYQKNGEWKHLESAHILLHQGVIPNINISLAAGCASHWNTQQACWAIDVDAWFQSSLPGIIVAGDGASIAGGVAAEQCGRIAALGAVTKIGKLTKEKRNSLAKPYQSALKAERRIRPFLDAMFRPADTFRIPEQAEIIVCRCEEITAGEIREIVANGCAGPNQLKSFSRCGMGPCQGRFCGLTVSELIAKTLDKPVSEVGYYRLRSPLKPLLLRELANLDEPFEH